MWVQRYCAQVSFMGVRLMWDDGFKDVFRPFVTEVGTAKHEKRRDHPREKITQDQNGGKQEKKLVAKRSRRDLANDRQFALSSEAKHIAWSDCCVIDNDTRRLDPGFGSLGHYIVKGGCRHLCDRRDIVEKRDQSDAQGFLLSFQNISSGERGEAAKFSSRGPKVIPRNREKF